MNFDEEQLCEQAGGDRLILDLMVSNQIKP